jgi:hypothetical protein
MSRVLVLEQMYLRQRPVIVKQHDRKKDKYWQEKCRFYLICMLIGILVGGIPLAVIVTMYARPQHYTTGNSSVNNTDIGRVPRYPQYRYNLYCHVPIF